MRNQYYYFVSGLPALSIDDAKLAITPQQFLTQAREQLSPGDFRLLLLLCLPSDVDDLLRVIYKNESANRPIDECSRWFWQTYADEAKARAGDPGIRVSKDYQAYPDAWHKICVEIFQAEELPPFLESQHKLLEATYEYCSNLGNKFLSSWFAFNRDLQNILIAINGRQHNIPFARYLVGSGEIVDKLAQSHAADLGLGKESELFESLLRIWEQNNILYRERGYDILRWKWIDSQNFFNYFNIDRILGYYAQLRILNRWQSMDPVLGKEVFHDSMDSLSNSFSFPPQFNVKSISKK